MERGKGQQRLEHSCGRGRLPLQGDPNQDAPQGGAVVAKGSKGRGRDTANYKGANMNC